MNSCRMCMNLVFVLLLLLCQLQGSICYRFADHVLGINKRDDGETMKNITTYSYAADLPPPTAELSCYQESWNISNALLSLCWQEDAGFALSGGKGDDLQDHALSCYGEVTTLGTRQLALEMGMSKTDCQQFESDDFEPIVFYDLGSGVGRLVAQVYFDHLHYDGLIHKAVGIELSNERHSIAAQALGSILQSDYHEVDPANFSLYLLQGDALEVDWKEDVTHIYMSSLCFPAFVVKELQNQILKAQHIRVVASLNRLQLLSMDKGWTEHEANIQMSWGPGVVMIYKHIARGDDTTGNDANY